MAINFAAFKELSAKIKQSFSFGSIAGDQLETQDVKGSGYKQLLGQVISFVIFTLITFWVISQVRVDGPIYKSIKEYQDLRSDILPPPLYVVESFASLNQAFVAAGASDYVTRDKKLSQISANERIFKNRISVWREQLKDDKELEGKLEVVSKTGENFFNIAKQKYIPALLIGTTEAIGPLGELSDSYEVQKNTIGQLVASLAAANESFLTKEGNFIHNVLIGLALLSVLIIIFMMYFGGRQVKAVESGVREMTNVALQNQTAVLRLLDEMGDLADGDLTVNAQVTESITGAIADSINYTIDSLRDLVVEINRATEQVNQATEQAQVTSVSLLSAAEQQSSQIIETTDAVSNMTRSILQVSSNAGEASDVAQRSLLAATQGSVAVQNTITGMNEIRSQIQETSKRIKRLGESSQEISEIVELISDITEQTNILALNAAIQAASAGEAGRGFTVVAEEVQRLAERSSEATKQISAIVKTIQTDTNSAVVAMEKSTEGVVEGARLSDAAGKALTEIETVSNDLARLIGSISSATVAQTEVAAVVTRNMQQIQNITTQTTDGTKLTAESVGQLNRLAEELRESVAGFKLA
ncbi:MAG: methyl-accepting chemotaxis protein [Methylophilaceae bacterium]|nr:methyl-accepting chemotaxis protein [Methylophilaceae bacterium]